MKQFLITVAGVLVGLVLFVIVVPFALISAIGNSTKRVEPSAIVLTLDMREAITDQSVDSPFAFGGGASTVDIVRKLQAAASDKAVKGLVLRASTAGLAPAQAEEIRTAIAEFRKSGKFTLAHLQNDALQTSITGYAAVAGVEELWLQETGDFMPMGMASDTMFLGGAFEKFHVTPQFEQRSQFKNAVNVYTEKTYTPAHKEATESLLNGLFDAFVGTIAADRKMSLEDAKRVISGTPYPSKQAVELKLADQLGRPEDVERAALKRAGKGVEMVDLMDYRGPESDSGPVIALVSAEGAIVSGPAEPSLFGSSDINSDRVAAALAKAADDDEVKAIVFRVSSPGGSPVASDQIAHAVAYAREAGKPVVVSMGQYAASGGYYISAGADSIVALPTTITGSIGIFGGKLVLGEAMERYLGVTTGNVSVGSNLINMGTPDRLFTNAERQAFAAWIDRGYVDFKGKVAAGRKLTPERVEEIAKGRVWTGAQAKERGLVDELGGLDVALSKAKVLAGLKPDAKISLRTYQETSPVEQLRELLGVSAQAAQGAVILGAVAGDEKLGRALRAVLAERATTGLQAREDVGDIR